MLPIAIDLHSNVIIVLVGIQEARLDGATDAKVERQRYRGGPVLPRNIDCIVV